MTLVTTSTAAYMNTDATFRAWGSPVDTSILSCGWAHSGDSGGINWTTATKPSVVNTPAGGQIYVMQDALQGTYPVFLKIEFGCGNPTSVPCIWASVGTGSDGVGNLTGQLGTRIQLTTQLGGSTAYTSRFAGASNRLVFGLWVNNGTIGSTLFVSIERTHDNAGGDTNHGIVTIFCGYGSTSVRQYQVIPFSGAVPAARSSTDHAVIVPATGTGASGADTYVYPFRIWENVYESSPSLNLFAYFNADLTVFNAVDAACWDGNTHNIYPLGSTFPFPSSYGGTAVYATRND